MLWLLFLVGVFLILLGSAIYIGTHCCIPREHERYRSVSKEGTDGS